MPSDPSGLVHFHGREYDPVLERWLSVDPLGITFEENGYRFNHLNPLSFIDPDGLAPQLLSITRDLSGKQVAAGYAGYQFGQGYGIGLHSPPSAGDRCKRRFR